MILIPARARRPMRPRYPLAQPLRRHVWSLRDETSPRVPAQLKIYLFRETNLNASAFCYSVSPSKAPDRNGSQDFRCQLEGYGLTAANIMYRRPDYPWLLQTYVWQDFDLFPKFPALNKSLNFWIEKLDGPLHSGDGGARVLDQAGRA